MQRRCKSPPIVHDRRRWVPFVALAALSSTAACAAFLGPPPPPSVRRSIVDDRSFRTMVGPFPPLLECALGSSSTCPRDRWAVAFTTMAAGRRTATATEEDPYAVLGIPPGTTDAREIKRAYRRMAMRYHPDVAGDDVDPAEANERFVRINAAYELLSGKTGAQNGGTGSKSGTSSRTTTGGAGYTPPHRRSGPYSSPSSSGGRTYTTEDWRDYMPKDYYVRDDDEDEYDADGDSFTAIFSDLIEGIAAATATGGQGGILTDLIEFLEGNFPEFVVEDGGIGGGSGSDGLESILRSNDFDLIKDEMDDATLLVQQLETKLGTVERDIARLEVAASGGGGGSFATRMEREAELEELRARRKVVEGYVKRARKRLLRLQTKVKEMRDSRSSGGIGGGGYGSSRGTYASSSTQSGGGSVGGGGEKYRSADSYGASVNAGTNDVASTGEDATATGSGTERESFGSFGRGRGRSRSRDRSSSSGAASRSTSSSTADGGRPGTYASSSSSSTRSSSTQKPRPSTSTSNVGASPSAQDSLKRASSVPPHRRSSPSWKQEREEKKRLRELQVDDEFDKLKKELGL